MSGPLHIYFTILLAGHDGIRPELVTDNAKAHESDEPNRKAATAIQRAASTGSISSGMASRWDTGTSCQQAPFILSFGNLEDGIGDDDEEDYSKDDRGMEDFQWFATLPRVNSTGSITTESSLSALSRWDSACLRKDGAIKKPLRKEAKDLDDSGGSNDSSPSCIKDVIRVHEEKERFSRRLDIPTELFRVH